MIKKHRKFIIFISIIAIILMWMPSTMRKRILLMPLSVQVWTPDVSVFYWYSSLNIIEENGETYVDIYMYGFDERQCKRVISIVEKYMKRHPYIFLNDAKICIRFGIASERISFYNYDGEIKYDYFAKMGIIEKSGYGFECIEMFPDTKVLGCNFYDNYDINELTTYLSYLTNPEKIYFYCDSESDFTKIKSISSDIFPNCKVLDKGGWWNGSGIEGTYLKREKSFFKLIKFVITISLLMVNIVLLPSTTKKRFRLLPLRFQLWSRNYRLRFRHGDLQVTEKDGEIYVNIDIPISCAAVKCKKIIVLVEKYMKKHLNSFLNNAKVSITIGNRPYSVCICNYDDGMIYKKFMVIYTGCNEKYPMEEYIREFPDCKVL